MKKKTLTNKKIYEEIFFLSLSIKNKKYENCRYMETEEWDSISHMTLISNIEKKFKINLSSKDIFNFKTFYSGLKILKKHKIKL